MSVVISPAVRALRNTAAAMNSMSAYDEEPWFPPMRSAAELLMSPELSLTVLPSVKLRLTWTVPEDRVPLIAKTEPSDESASVLVAALVPSVTRKTVASETVKQCVANT